MTTPVFRFAPSPNGELPLGHAYSALLNQQMARAAGGRLLLRIEDIDTGRTREHFVQRILEDLSWLGLTWEEPVRRQSRYFDVYRAAAARLAAMGLLYPCFCTRREIEAAAATDAARDPDGAVHYPGTCRGQAADAVQRRMSSGEPHALRIHMAAACSLALGGGPLTFCTFAPDGAERMVTAQPARWGDAVIVRKDTPTSYHLSVVVDDALQGITHVVRGADLEAATDLHRLLQALLRLPVPRYHHHRLITDDTGRKLAKSLGDVSLASLRRDGVSAGDVRGLVLPDG